MLRPRIARSLVLTAGLLLVGGAASGAEPEPDTTTPAQPAQASTDQAWTILHVGGEPEGDVEAVERPDGETWYRAGGCAVLEALPEGYPRPTAPGAIEIKRYPSVRRAEIEGGRASDDGPMRSRTTRAFWPLFKHIKERKIAMTAPVEMDYAGMSASGEAESWTMSFLYRTPELGETGRDGRIRVYDSAPVKVLSIGVRGVLSESRIRESLATLEGWLGESDEWRRAGDPRTLGYNGPMVPAPQRWWEVQIPVEPVESDR